MQNSITGEDAFTSNEVLEATLSMMKDAFENDDFQNTRLSLETEDGTVTEIEVYEDMGTLLFQVGDRSPHFLEQKGSWNIASLKNDLRAELKSCRDSIIFFNCGITNDMILEENNKIEDVSEEINTEELEDVLERELDKIASEDEHTGIIEENQEETDAYDSVDLENDIYQENHGIAEIVKPSSDINNFFRLEQLLLKEDEDYVLKETEPGTYKLTNNNLPAKFNVSISKHGVIVSTDSPVRPDDLDLFNKMCNDAKTAVAKEYELEEKEAHYNAKTLAGRPTYEYLERLVEEFQERAERNETSEITYSFKDGKGKDFCEISIKPIGNMEESNRDINAELSCKFSEEYGGAEEKININTLELQNSNIKETKENEMLISFADLVISDELRGKITYELRDDNGLIEEIDQNARKNVVISDNATFGQKIDELSSEIKAIVDKNVIPTINTTRNTLKTMNNVRKGFIRAYSDGVMSGVELMSGVKDFREGWKTSFSVEKLENALSSFHKAALQNVIDKVLSAEGYDRDIIKNLSGEEKNRIDKIINDTKERFISQEMTDIYYQHYLGNSLGKAIYNLEKYYVNLHNNPNVNKYQLAKVKQEIHIARNYLTKDLTEFQRCAVLTRIKAEKAIDELNKLKQKIKENTVEKLDIERARNAVKKFRESMLSLAQKMKEKTNALNELKPSVFREKCKKALTNRVTKIKSDLNQIKHKEEKYINADAINKRNTAELINDSFIKIPMTDVAFIKTFDGRYFYEELEYKENIYNEELRDKDDSSLTPMEMAKKTKYEKDLEQKEIVDYIAKGVIKAEKEILETPIITKEAAIEKLAETIRNFEVSYNSINNIDNTDIYSKLKDYEKMNYKTVAENIVNLDPLIKIKFFAKEKILMEKEADCR